MATSPTPAHSRRHAVAVNPLASLLFWAAFPAVILTGLWQFASSHDNSAAPTFDIAAEFAPMKPQVAILSSRRSPHVLARETSSTSFEQALRPLGGVVLPGSCSSVSVDGVLAFSDGIDTPVTPASSLKLLVAGVALDVLGDDFVYTTQVLAEITNGTVGSIYLVGGGDPLLSSAWYPEDTNFTKYPQVPATSLEELADAVVAAGVTQIAGNVVGDASRYDAELYAPDWPIGFRAVQGGPISSLLINDGWVFGETLKATDPALGAAHEFVRLLKERGIMIAGGAATGRAPQGLPPIAQVDSAPLSSIIGELLQNSDNNTAELLLKELGLRVNNVGSRSAGIAAVTAKLLTWKIPIQGFLMVDGSGLSSENKVSCATFQAFLERYKVANTLVSAMAIAGKSGTLSDYFRNDPMQGRLLGKTGSLSGVKALIGFLAAPGGSTLRFTLLLEIPGIDDETSFQPIWENQLSDALNSYPAGPLPESIAPLAAIANS